MRGRGIAAVVLALGLGESALGQVEQQRSRVAGSRESAAPVEPGDPPRLAVEVNTHAGPPGYVAVSRPGARLGWAWFARFGRTKGGDEPVADRVTAIKVVPRIEDGQVRIDVSVLRGRFQEREEPVASYVVEPGSKILAKDLEAFGIVPIDLRIIRVARPYDAPPRVENNTQSIEVVGLESVDHVFSRHRLLLRNNSSKGVMAMFVQVVVDDRQPLSKRLEDAPEGPLIGPGDLYETEAGSSRGQTSGDELTPEITGIIRVSAVVFEDGSSEGDRVEVAMLLAGRQGRALQVQRGLALINSTFNAPVEDVSRALKSAGRLVASLGDDAEGARVAQLLSGTPGLGERERTTVALHFKYGMHRARGFLLEDIERYEASRTKESAVPVWLWLRSLNEKYERWLKAGDFTPIR